MPVQGEQKIFHTLTQVTLGILYGLYLTFLAPASARHKARKWLTKQTDISTPEQEIPATQSPLPLNIAKEHPWLAKSILINSVSKGSYIVIAPPSSQSLPLKEVNLQPIKVETVSKAQATKLKQKKMTVNELRKQCSAKGIEWRNVRGKNKHLSKTEMLQKLAA